MALEGELRSFARRQPWPAMAAVLATFTLLSVLNYALHRVFQGIPFSTPLWFPLAQSPGFLLNSAGLPFAALFILLLLGVTWTPGLRINILQAWLIGLAFILLGNLMQGGLDIGFREPLTSSGIQYYHDALRIDSPAAWLRQFNSEQQGLFVHGRTHPPFAVLSHYWAMQLMGDRPFRLAAFLVLVASFSIPLVGWAFSELGMGRHAAGRWAVLFALIPAVNIYTAVSLDGVILTAGAAFLLGMLMLIRRRAVSLLGSALLISGLVVMNLLSFAGTFGFAVCALVGAAEVLLKRNWRLLAVLAAAAAVLAVLMFAVYGAYGYDHIQAFITASRLENPEGFYGFDDPVNYALTRLECIGEIIFFFSIGAAAYLLMDRPWTGGAWKMESDAVRIAIAAVATLALMYLVGMNRVGETARSSMFIYPFLLLLFREQEETAARDLAVLAGFQTLLMQLFSRFFW